MLRERNGEGANDSFTIRLHYLTGLTATLSANSLSSLPRPRFHLRGTKGNYRKYGLDPQEEALTKITRVESENWGAEHTEHWGILSLEGDELLTEQPVETAAGDYRLFYEAVRDALRGEANPPVSGVDAWRTARLLEWTMESSKPTTTSTATGPARRSSPRQGPVPKVRIKNAMSS